MVIIYFGRATLVSIEELAVIEKGKLVVHEMAGEENKPSISKSAAEAKPKTKGGKKK